MRLSLRYDGDPEVTAIVDSETGKKVDFVKDISLKQVGRVEEITLTFTVYPPSMLPEGQETDRTLSAAS